MARSYPHIRTFIISVVLGLAVFSFFVITENPAVLTAAFWAGKAVSESAGAVSGTISDYKTVGIRAGIYSNGQASFWDLPLFDHFFWTGLFSPAAVSTDQKARARGYKPPQPIGFSHVTHVQQYKMECQYCHWTVAKSPFAAIPEEQSCIGCHNKNIGMNLGRNDGQKAEIAKIGQYYDAGEPIPWVKVHVMPDHVRFNHKRHVKGGIGCQACHGQVPEMSVVERVSSMKMGWCVSCHREKGASIDCWTCHK